MSVQNLESDYIIVGSGPGGATLARELARRSKRVLLLERGLDYRTKPYYGTYLGPLRYAERGSFLYTKEGLNVVRPLMVGGATSMYCGCAAPPPDWFKEKYLIDLDAYVSATIEELELAPLPPELCGTASTRIAQAGRALGQDWQPQLKFMRPHRAARFDCGAKCMLGCRCGAKWNAAEWVDDAEAAGAKLKTQARVERVLIEDGRAVGVQGRLGRTPFTAKAQTVILAAGGIGSPRILHKSGLPDAGNGMTMDTTVMVYGVTKERGIGNEPPMTWSSEERAGGYMLSTLIDPWLNYPLVSAQKGLRYSLRWLQWNHMLGVMIKLKDNISGGVFSDGTISKPMTKDDGERLKSAEDVARRILVQAGADSDTLFTTPLRGTHPSGTVRIGDLLDRNLETPIAGLYVCDASVFPEALARPTVLTIIGLAKRLAQHLLL